MNQVIVLAVVSLVLAAAFVLVWLVGRDDRRQTQFAQSVIVARHLAAERRNRVHS
jgi:hypothetical protein